VEVWRYIYLFALIAVANKRELWLFIIYLLGYEGIR
jgi:hypothetical protein